MYLLKGMKKMQVKVKENTSLFKKIIDKIKNSSLYYMINSSDAEVISPEEIDSTEKVSISLKQKCGI